MARVAVLGERVRVQGFALAGARRARPTTPAEVRAAWASLADDVAVVVLTPRPPRRSLTSRRRVRGRR